VIEIKKGGYRRIYRRIYTVETRCRETPLWKTPLTDQSRRTCPSPFPGLAEPPTTGRNRGPTSLLRARVRAWRRLPGSHPKGR